MHQRFLKIDPSPHLNLKTEDPMAVVHPIEVNNAPGLTYTVSRINPLYTEDIEGIMSPTADSYNETYSLRRGRLLQPENNIKRTQSAYDASPGLKQILSTKNHEHFEELKRVHSLPPRLRAKRLRNGHHWLGFNIIHVSAKHVSSIAVNRALKISRNELQVPSIIQSPEAINTREHELDVRVNSEFVKNISLRAIPRKKHNCPALRVIHNSEFVKNVSIICMHNKQHEAQSANMHRSENHRYLGPDHVTVQPVRSDGDDEENCLDSIVTNSLLEMTSREPSPVSSLSRHCSQEPILKQTCWNEEAGQCVLQELSQAISHCEPVTRLQKVSGDFKIYSSSDSSEQLSGFAQTGECSPQQESASPLSLVIRLFRGQSTARRGQKGTIDVDDEEQTPTTERRKSWFQRWASHRKRSRMSEDSGSRSPDSVYSVLEVADLQDIIIQPTRSEKPFQATTSSNTLQNVSTETDPYRTETPIPTERHVSFSIDEDIDARSNSKKVWQQLPDGGTGPISVESLIQMLSDKNATDSDREKLWNHFYSSQASSEAQLMDKKMLRSWQAARQAKDRNLSAFTLDFGRAASLRRRSVKRKRARKACHVFTILLVIMCFIGIIVLVSWLGSGGRKLFGSL